VNNTKCSNVMLAMADATSSMAVDYEQQVQQLKQVNDGLLKQVQQMAGDQSKALAVVHRMHDMLIDRSNAVVTDAKFLTEGQFCEQMLDALSDMPWSIPNPTPKKNEPPAGSSGGPKTIPTS
jgi:hypothetical protein